MMDRDLFLEPEDIFHWGIKGLIRNTDGNILIMEEVIPVGLQWDLPGGRVHTGKTILETLSREIAEETGITQFVNQGLFLTCLSKNRIRFKQRDVGLILSVYELKIDDSVKIKISDEHKQYSWMSPKEAARLLSKKFPAEFTEKIAQL